MSPPEVPRRRSDRLDIETGIADPFAGAVDSYYDADIGRCLGRGPFPCISNGERWWPS